MSRTSDPDLDARWRLPRTQPRSASWVPMLEPQALERAQATERERVLLRVWGGLEAVAKPHHRVAVAEGRGDLRAGADLAWATKHPTSWISSLCADPTDSPRSKGRETSLEPYRTPSRNDGGSCPPFECIKRVGPNLSEPRTWRRIHGLEYAHPLCFQGGVRQIAQRHRQRSIPPQRPGPCRGRTLR